MPRGALFTAGESVNCCRATVEISVHGQRVLTAAHPKGPKSTHHRDTCTSRFINSLVTIARRGNQSRALSTHERRM